MKVTTRCALAAVLAIAGVAGAGAQSPKIRQLMRGEDRGLLADVADTNRICQAKITVGFDWSNAPQGELERAEAGTARRHCDEALKSFGPYAALPRAGRR